MNNDRSVTRITYITYIVPNIHSDEWEIRLTTLEVILRVNTLVRLLSELRAPKYPTGGITVITPKVSLPFVEIALVWGLAGAAEGRSALSVTFLVGGLADTLSVGGSVTVRTVEIAGVILGANRDRVIWVVAVSSSILHLQVWVTSVCRSSQQGESDQRGDRWTG